MIKESRTMDSTNHIVENARELRKELLETERNTSHYLQALIQTCSFQQFNFGRRLRILIVKEVYVCIYLFSKRIIRAEELDYNYISKIKGFGLNLLEVFSTSLVFYQHCLTALAQTYSWKRSSETPTEPIGFLSFIY